MLDEERAGVVELARRTVDQLERFQTTRVHNRNRLRGNILSMLRQHDKGELHRDIGYVALERMCHQAIGFVVETTRQRL